MVNHETVLNPTDAPLDRSRPPNLMPRGVCAELLRWKEQAQNIGATKISQLMIFTIHIFVQPFSLI